MSSTPDSAETTLAPPSPQDAGTGAENLVIIARQAILDEHRAVFG
jgi:hypothetical protein